MRISESEMEVFRELSGNCNPLHTSPEFARSAGFEAPIVYGALAALRVLRDAEFGRGSGALSVRARFVKPMYAQLPYDVSVATDGELLRCEARQGTETALVLEAGSSADSPRGRGGPEPGWAASAIGIEPVIHRFEDLRVGQRVGAAYALPLAAAASLSGDLRPSVVLALAWASYLPGMCLPGLWSLCTELQLRIAGESKFTDLWFMAEVTELDDRFRLVRSRASLLAGTEPVADAEISCIMPQG